MVRRLGYGQTHVVDVAEREVQTASFLGADFRCIDTPAGTECGVVLRDRAGALVLMKPGTAVHCRACRRITGLSRAAEDNTL